jgi:hypothetical protein
MSIVERDNQMRKRAAFSEVGAISFGWITTGISIAWQPAAIMPLSRGAQARASNSAGCCEDVGAGKELSKPDSQRIVLVLRPSRLDRCRIASEA